MNEDLRKIKDHFGENFAKLCRELFPTLLEKEGLLPALIMKHFADNHFLYEDIVNSHSLDEFKNYIYGFIDVEKEENNIIKTPKELLDEAGYALYECKTEEEIQSFKKYYKEDETLCTFNGGRLNKCFVFFAVRKDVDEIKREDFSNPQRQDKYGTSVMSIQFYRGKNNTVSIKNRYNHTVNNPDATYSNHLDNIINGLTSSFEREYGLNIGEARVFQFELDNYIKANDGKYYKYNYEINNIYYCPNNIIIDNGNPKVLDKSRYIEIDYFIIDLKEKKIIALNGINDDFVNGFADIVKIDIHKKDDKKCIVITPKIGKKILIVIDKTNRIVEYNNENLETVGDYFLCYNKVLQELNVPSLTIVGCDFLRYNRGLQELNAPSLTTVSDYFLIDNICLQKLNVSSLTTVGKYFLCSNENLEELNVPSLIEVEDCFLIDNENLEKISAPSLETVGRYFLRYNNGLQELNVPSLTTVGDYFLNHNENLQELNAPNLTTVGDDFLCDNKCLQELNASKLITVGDCFLINNENLEKISVPSLETVGRDFLKSNENLEKVNAQSLTTVGDCFLYYNEDLQELNAPSLTTVGDDFLAGNENLEKLNVPCLIEVGDYFLSDNKSLQKLNVPKLAKIGDCFLCSNRNLQGLNAPSLTTVGDDFLSNNKCLQELNVPNLTTVGHYFLHSNSLFCSAYERSQDEKVKKIGKK